VTFHCPNIHTFNLVTMDNGLTSFNQMTRLRRATLELEDCFGLGLFQFLNCKVGENLVELTLSCSSGENESCSFIRYLYNVFRTLLSQHTCFYVSLNLCGRLDAKLGQKVYIRDNWHTAPRLRTTEVRNQNYNVL